MISTAWAPERDYFPPWLYVPGVAEQRDVALAEGASAPIGRFVPLNPVLLTQSAAVKKKDVVPAGTILVRIEEQPFTACEMVRPAMHESFACFVDQNGDGRFEGTYRLFSHSYFLLVGWTNRSPDPIAPVTYAVADPHKLADHVELEVRHSKRTKNSSVLTVRNCSTKRCDGWVNSGTLTVGPETVGRTAWVLGARIHIKRINATGPVMDIIPPSGEFTTTFRLQKSLWKRPDSSAEIPWTAGSQ